MIGIVRFDERFSDPTWHKVVGFVGMDVATLGALAVSFAHRGEPGETADTLPPATAAPAT